MSDAYLPDMLTCCGCEHRRVFDGSSPSCSMTGEPILSSHSLSVVYHVLVSSPTAAHSRACLVFHQLLKHLDGSPVPKPQTYGRKASWHRLIACSNLLGKHDEAPLLCPVLDLICRGKAPHCRQPSSGSREGTSKRQGRDPPSSPFTFHANVDCNTTQTGPIAGNPSVKAPRRTVYCIYHREQSAQEKHHILPCAKPSWSRDSRAAVPRMKMTMHDLSPARIFRVSGNLLLEIADGDLTLKTARDTSEVAQVAIQPTSPYIWPPPATLSHLAGVSLSSCITCDAVRAAAFVIGYVSRVALIAS